MSFKKRLIALRHTTVGLPLGVCYGQLDVPLAESYAGDLEVVRKNLPHLPDARVLSSPLQRCYRLATDLFPNRVDRDARLMELSFGEWEGLLWADIPRAVSEHWTQDVLNRSPPGGETFLQLIVRIQNLLEDPAAWSMGPELLIVTHAGVIRALHHIFSGDDVATSLRVPIHFGEHRVWEF